MSEREPSPSPAPRPLQVGAATPNSVAGLHVQPSARPATSTTALAGLDLQFGSIT
jgi:hypothetical protein